MEKSSSALLQMLGEIGLNAPQTTQTITKIGIRDKRQSFGEYTAQLKKKRGKQVSWTTDIQGKGIPSMRGVLLVVLSIVVDQNYAGHMNCEINGWWITPVKCCLVCSKAMHGHTWSWRSHVTDPYVHLATAASTKWKQRNQTASMITTHSWGVSVTAKLVYGHAILIVHLPTVQKLVTFDIALMTQVSTSSMSIWRASAIILYFNLLSFCAHRTHYISQDNLKFFSRHGDNSYLLVQCQLM